MVAENGGMFWLGATLLEQPLQVLGTDTVRKAVCEKPPTPATLRVNSAESPFPIDRTDGVGVIVNDPAVTFTVTAV